MGRYHWYFLFLLFGLLLASCNEENVSSIKFKPDTLFTIVPESTTGVDFSNIVTQNDSFNCVKYTYALIGAGVAVGDVNNDGLTDIYIAANQTSNKLYLNKGGFAFSDVTLQAGVSDDKGWTTGVAMIDINNDGWLDIYVCKSGSPDKNLRKNKLFINQKDGTFKDQANIWGLDQDGYSIQSYFFDYDRDGDLDMYLVNHRHDFQNTLRLEQKENQKFYPETSDHLFRNNGLSFSDVTSQAGLINKAWGLSASIGDFNNDGWPDIYVANDYIAPDYLYINNKRGGFTNQINTRLKHISYNSMGSDFADINNDFLPDLMVLEMSSEDHVRSKQNMATMDTEGFRKIVEGNHHYPYMANVLQLNNGNGSFSDIGQLAQVSKTDWSWAPLLVDFDNDGYKDIFITNGVERNFSNQDFAQKVKQNMDENVEMTIQEVIEMMPSEKLSNYSYKNNGDLTFTNTSKEWGFVEKINSNGVAYADFDNDGDMDLVMNNMSDLASIYQNHSINNFLKIKLQGRKSNINGIGAKVSIYTDDGNQYQELYVSRGYQSSVSDVLLFGLGKTQVISRVEVQWGDNSSTIIKNPKVNTLISVNINDSNGAQPTKNVVNRSVIPVKPESIGLNFKHEENAFNDFSKQVLLPQKISQIGPALAVSDVNNDGLEDVFIGGAAGQKAKIYLQNKLGTFALSEQSIFSTDRKFEDVDAHFFDADGDQDLDLYVVSAGYEFEEKSPLLQDRLYLNNGKGIYNRSKGLPPMLSSSKKVGSFDIDNDGDLDLIVGGYVISGKYPQAERSYILKNEQGVFLDITDEIAPGFKTLGIVNDFIFSDYDNDNDADLIVVGEWMPIVIFNNNNGIYTQDTDMFEQSEGWWNSIAARDIDNDGDLDYLFGNLGGNNKFHPSVEKPLHIFGNNFDNNSTYDMVLSKDYKGDLVPIRGKECSTDQNPFIAEKAATFNSFALSTLVDLYGQEELDDSYHKMAKILESSYAINNGDGSFSFKKLPSTAQFGPTLGFQFADVNKDGFDDVIGIGSIFEAEVETIKYDGNVGYVLLGNKDGKLRPYKDINFYINGNSKKIDKIKIKGQDHLIIANNDGPLSIFGL